DSTIDGAIFAASLMHAVELVDRAIAEPVEGTVITVLRCAAEKAEHTARQPDPVAAQCYERHMTTQCRACRLGLEHCHGALIHHSFSSAIAAEPELARRRYAVVRQVPALRERADDLPSFQLSHTTTLCPGNPLGVKGCGEAGAIGSSAAVINAITDAIGNNKLEMPATPDRVWHAIQG
ncbi:hypothetical protein, partial [uncultured Bradyrhizobium sp.]|uniref:hypothetical protein n=1 Tax=uncultured Bradyrhizobium sp. TaxID=199684 RepID=UPI002624AD77